MRVSDVYPFHAAHYNIWNPRIREENGHDEDRYPGVRQGEIPAVRWEFLFPPSRAKIFENSRGSSKSSSFK